MILRLLILVLLCGCASAKQKPKPKPESHVRKMALKDNLLAYWGFEFSPQLYPQIFDESGNSNHLSPNNFVVGGTGVVPAKLGNGIETDGSQLFSLTAGSAGISHLGDDFTVIMWIKFSSLEFFGSVAVHSEWSVVLNADLIITIDGKALTIPAASIETGKWYFLAFGWNSGPPGFLWATLNLENGIQTPRSAISHVFGSFLVGSSIVGVFDDFAIFRRSVPDEELSRIYNKGDGLAFEDYEESECGAITCCDQ